MKCSPDPPQLIDFGIFKVIYILGFYWESVASSVIQATGTAEFEDGLLIGN